MVARAAKAAQIPILVEAERLRADLDMLMAEADYIVTSSHFPEDWTGEDNVGDAILATLLRLPAVKFMVCFHVCHSNVPSALFVELSGGSRIGLYHSQVHNHLQVLYVWCMC